MTRKLGGDVAEAAAVLVCLACLLALAVSATPADTAPHPHQRGTHR